VENNFLKNKIIIKYCPDYYRIINERFTALDYMSDKVIQVYQSYIFSIEPRNKIDLKRAIVLNAILVKYFDDREFKTEISSILKTLRVPKGTENILVYIVNTMIQIYNKYMKGYTRNIYIPKWV
jgi:hypothetical protein